MSEQLNLGRDIRGARENSGYTIADVEKITCIPAYILKDIEANKFNSIKRNEFIKKIFNGNW